MEQQSMVSFKTFILTTAQSMGIESVDTSSLGPDIEYRLREIIQVSERPTNLFFFPLSPSRSPSSSHPNHTHRRLSSS